MRKSCSINGSATAALDNRINMYHKRNCSGLRTRGFPPIRPYAVAKLATSLGPLHYSFFSPFPTLLLIHSKAISPSSLGTAKPSQPASTPPSMIPHTGQSCW